MDFSDAHQPVIDQRVLDKLVLDVGDLAVRVDIVLHYLIDDVQLFRVLQLGSEVQVAEVLLLDGLLVQNVVVLLEALLEHLVFDVIDRHFLFCLQANVVFIS